MDELEKMSVVQAAINERMKVNIIDSREQEKVKKYIE
jgi:hypothetical protein